METLLIVAFIVGVAWFAMRGSVARRRAGADEADSSWSTLRWLPTFLFIGAITTGRDVGTDSASLPHSDSWSGDGPGSDFGGFSGGGGE